MSLFRKIGWKASSAKVLCWDTKLTKVKKSATRNIKPFTLVINIFSCSWEFHLDSLCVSLELKQLRLTYTCAYHTVILCTKSKCFIAQVPSLLQSLVINTEVVYACSFVTLRHFHPSLIFYNKLHLNKALPRVSQPLIETHFKGMLLPLLTNIRLRYRSVLAVTNAPAYYAVKLIEKQTLPSLNDGLKGAALVRQRKWKFCIKNWRKL